MSAHPKLRVVASVFLLAVSRHGALGSIQDDEYQIEADIEAHTSPERRQNEIRRHSSLVAAGSTPVTVLRWALEIAWAQKSIGKSPTYTHSEKYEECSVHLPVDINSELKDIRDKSSIGFLQEGNESVQASKIAQDFFSDPGAQATQGQAGSRSGSSFYEGARGALLLKSEEVGKWWEKDLLELMRQPCQQGPCDDKKNVAFIKSYADRVKEDGCHRSTLMRYLLLFEVRCPSGPFSTTSVLWTLFANIRPYSDARQPSALVHKFDLKASRPNCHNPKWTGASGQDQQGLGGDFLALYKPVLKQFECSGPNTRQDFVYNETRANCLTEALLQDILLLEAYNLVDYSVFVSVHEYRGDQDDLELRHFNNLLNVTAQGKALVMSFGVIDLFKDGAGLSVMLQRLKRNLFGAAKFEKYGYYLFCLMSDVLVPDCENAEEKITPCIGDRCNVEYKCRSLVNKNREKMKTCANSVCEGCDLSKGDPTAFWQRVF